MNLDGLEKKCHVEAGPLCQFAKLKSMSVEYYKAYVQYQNYNEMQRYLDNPDFVKETVNLKYYMILELSEKERTRAVIITFFVLSLVIFVTLIVLFIIIYIKKRRAEKSAAKESLTS